MQRGMGKRVSMHRRWWMTPSMLAILRRTSAASKHKRLKETSESQEQVMVLTSSSLTVRLRPWPGLRLRGWPFLGSACGWTSRTTRP